MSTEAITNIIWSTIRHFGKTETTPSTQKVSPEAIENPVYLTLNLSKPRISQKRQHRNQPQINTTLNQRNQRDDFSGDLSTYSLNSLEKEFDGIYNTFDSESDNEEINIPTKTVYPKFHPQNTTETNKNRKIKSCLVKNYKPCHYQYNYSKHICKNGKYYILHIKEDEYTTININYNRFNFETNKVEYKGPIKSKKSVKFSKEPDKIVYIQSKKCFRPKSVAFLIEGRYGVMKRKIEKY